MMYLQICFQAVSVCTCSQGAAANPDSEEQQQKLREAAEGLRMATNAAAQNAIKKRLVNKLEVRRKIRRIVVSDCLSWEREYPQGCQLSRIGRETHEIGRAHV